VEIELAAGAIPGLLVPPVAMNDHPAGIVITHPSAEILLAE
jgi:hypothetical protein